MNSMTLDERAATCLALIAEAPKRNARLLDLLDGDVRLIGEIIVDPNSSSEASGQIRQAAQEILAWAKSNRNMAAAYRAERDPDCAVR